MHALHGLPKRAATSQAVGARAHMLLTAQPTPSSLGQGQDFALGSRSMVPATVRLSEEPARGPLGGCCVTRMAGLSMSLLHPPVSPTG